jgi:UDPglucose 6-dehydrogenase
MNIGFAGLGKLGMPCAEVMAQQHTVFGYDILPRKSDAMTICNSIEMLCRHSEIIFVAVPTPHEKGYDGSRPTSMLPVRDFDYTAVKECLSKLNEYCDENKPVVLISTVLPGTIREQLRPLLTSAPLIYNPYLIAMGTVAWDMVNPEMIIIGTEKNTQQEIGLLRSIYDPLMQNAPRYATGTWEEAESIKIFYNTFISAKLGLVNMIQDVAERLGNMNADTVCNALKESTFRITGPAYMKPGLGDGGPCHPRDNIALRLLSGKLNLGYDLFGTIMQSREQQAKNMADRLCSFGLPVIILGKSYKPGVPFTDGSFSVLVGYYVEQNRTAVFYDAAPDASSRYTYLIAHENKYAGFLFNKDSIVVDPWRSFNTKQDDIAIVYYGDTTNVLP